MKKITTYVLTISEYFPKTHKKAGLRTRFFPKITSGDKIHTIRGNYDLWAKRFEKINKGLAILSVRYWDGKPYNSTQREVYRFTKEHGIGIEKLTFSEQIMTPYECIIKKDGSIYTPHITKLENLAKNDGLSLEDFKDWFKGYDLSKPMAIIHFTNFRYK